MGPDPTPFFGDFKDAFFSYFFSYSLPAGTLSSFLKYNFLLKCCITILFCKPYFSLRHHYEKREESGSESIRLTNGSGSGRPKNMRILRIRIPNTGSHSNEIASKYSSIKMTVP
jgi:hypothetical protein